MFWSELAATLLRAFIFDRATSYSIESAHHLGTSSVPIAIVVCGISRPESPLAGIAFSIKKSRKLFIRNHIMIQLRFRENIKRPSTFRDIKYPVVLF